MHSLQQIIFRAVVLVVVLMVVDCYARPAVQPSDEDVTLHSRLVDAHARTAARKRHAEIRLNSEIARRMEELKRIQLLNNIMNGLDASNVYSVKNQADRQIPQPSPGLRAQKVNNEVYPSVPSHREISPHLLEQLNGQDLPGGVTMRIVQDEQSQPPPSADQFRRYIENAQNAVALAKTCRDMQAMIEKNHLRLRVKCLSSTNGQHHSHPRHDAR